MKNYFKEEYEFNHEDPKFWLFKRTKHYRLIMEAAGYGITDIEAYKIFNSMMAESKEKE